MAIAIKAGRPYAKQVLPDHERFRQFLIQRRMELGASTTRALRGRTGLPDGAPSGQTLDNIEGGYTNPEWSTFLWLPEIYKVGLLEMFAALYPEWEQTFDAEADVLAAVPSLRPLVRSLAQASEEVREFVERGLGSAGSVGASDGNGDPAIGGGLRARHA